MISSMMHVSNLIVDEAQQSRNFNRTRLALDKKFLWRQLVLAKIRRKWAFLWILNAYIADSAAVIGLNFVHFIILPTEYINLFNSYEPSFGVASSRG
jgi:hypothetical protein